jgi:hypothetical protein
LKRPSEIENLRPIETNRPFSAAPTWQQCRVLGGIESRQLD